MNFAPLICRSLVDTLRDHPISSLCCSPNDASTPDFPHSCLKQSCVGMRGHCGCRYGDIHHRVGRWNGHQHHRLGGRFGRQGGYGWRRSASKKIALFSEKYLSFTRLESAHEHRYSILLSLPSSPSSQRDTPDHYQNRDSLALPAQYRSHAYQSSRAHGVWSQCFGDEFGRRAKSCPARQRITP